MFKFHSLLPGENQWVQGRLMFAFSALFVFSILSMSFFLFNLVQTIELAERSRAIFERTRQLYRLDAMVKRHEMAVKQYMASGAPGALEESTVLADRINESVLQLNLPAEDQPDLEIIKKSIAPMTALAGKIFKAIDLEKEKAPRNRNTNALQALSLENDQLMQSMYQALERMSRRGVDQLLAIQFESQTLNQVAFWSGAATIAFFFALLLVSSLMAYRFINLPTEQLIRAVYSLNAGKRDHPEIKALTHRTDEIGELATEFLHMADEIAQRNTQLEQEAEKIRAKIHP